LAEKAAPPNIFKPKELRWKQQPPSHQANQKHNDQCRQYSSDPPCVESGKAELPFLQILHQQTGDQKSRDDEKYIETYIAARNQARRGVKSDNPAYTSVFNFFPPNAYAATLIAKARIGPTTVQVA
jgi:hypothetical protein